MKEEICKRIKKYLGMNFYYGIDEEIDNEMSLIDSGMIDSTGIVDLVVYLEEEFSIEIPDYEILPENFNSINSISNYLTSKVKVY